MEDKVLEFKTPDEEATPVEKEEISSILSERRLWKDVNEEKPPKDIPVVVRLVNRDKIFNESENQVLYAEDIKIARMSEDETFKIDPPFPKYDFSPLTNKEELYEGTEISHWAFPEEGELEGWYTRYNPIRSYKHLKIEADEETEMDVYRALSFGSSAISRLYRFNPTMAIPDDAPEDVKELFKFYEILCDLQSYFDNPSAFKSGE